MSEREEESQVLIIPEDNLPNGFNATWGLGNQLFVYAKGDKPAKGNEQARNYAGSSKIHEICWNTDMHGSVSRKLVNESRNIFMALQSLEQETEGHPSRERLNQFSQQYRAVITVCVLGLQNELENASCEDVIELESQLQLFNMAELVWSLCEILFVNTLPGGAVLQQLLVWLKWHFTEGQKMAEDVVKSPSPETHQDYWQSIYSFVLQGHTDGARQMLSLHTDRESAAFASIDELLRKMPVFVNFTGKSLAEFDMKWRHWQDECIQRLEDGEFATNNNLHTICRILAGEDEVFLELSDLCESWYHMLISRLFYQNPTVKAFDLQYHTEFCIEAFGGNMNMMPWDNILLSALEFDIHQVIKESSASSSNWWFVAHLTDLLHHCGQLESQRLNFGSNLREFLLLEYASSLMSHNSLWEVGAEYLDHCPEFGRHYLQHYIEHLPLQSEQKAQKVLRVCEKRDMQEQARSICKVMGMRALHNGRLGSALSWCLRSKDVAFVTFLAEKFLNEYTESGGFSNLDLIDNLGPSMLISSKLTFLGKYREFHQLYENGEFKAATSLLLNFLKERMAPKKFWLTLLTDALPLLEAEEVMFSSAQTYELMNCLEEITVTLKLDQSADSSGDKMDTLDAENEKLELMKLALARNLARAIAQEGSIEP